MKNKDAFQHLITLFHLFNGMPELLAQKMLQFNCLNPEFIKKVESNESLLEYTNDQDQIMNKPYFKDLKEVHAFYDKFFVDGPAEIKRLPATTNPQYVLQQQLQNAVEKENYELAANIKAYMLLVGFVPENF